MSPYDSFMPGATPSLAQPDPLRRARLAFQLAAARLDRTVLELSELLPLLEPLLPPDDEPEDDATCRPGRAGLARRYGLALEALLCNHLAGALAELEAALRATVEAPGSALEDGEAVLARRLAALKPGLPSDAGVEATAVASIRQLIAAIHLAADREEK